MGKGYYDDQKIGVCDTIHPDLLCLGVTTLGDLGITDEMVEWITTYGVTPDRIYYKKLGDTWSTLVTIDEYDGERSLALSMDNIAGTSEEMYLSFKESAGEWILDYAFATFAVGEKADSDASGMTYDEFCNLKYGDAVEVVAYVQAKSEWIHEFYMTVFAQNEDGAYYVSGLECTKEEYDRLVPGSKIRITGINGMNIV